MKSPRTTIGLAAALLLVASIITGSPAKSSRADDQPKARVQDKDRNKQLLQILAEVQQALDASDNKPVYYFRTLRHIAEAQTKFGEREAAKATLRKATGVAVAAKQAVGNNSYGLSSAHQLWEVGHAQAELGDKEGARATLILALQAKDEQNSDFLRVMTLANIAKDFTALGAHDEALQAAGQADIYHAIGGGRNDQVIVPDVAAAHAGAGDIDGAFAILDAVEASPKNPVVKESIIGRALGKIAEAVEAADRETARSALDRARRRLDAIAIDEHKYSALIDLPRALAKIGDYEGAKEVVRSGARPDGRVYAMILIAGVQNQAGDREGARKTLRESYETAKREAGGRATISRLSQVASAMIYSDDLEGARRCVEDMAPGQRHETLAEIAAVQKRHSDEAGARATFRRALEDVQGRRGNQPQPDADASRFRPPGAIQWDTQTERNLARIQAMMGDYDNARKTAEAIPDPVWRAISLTDVARAQAANGDPRGALEWIRKLKLSPRTQNPLEGVIEGIGDFADAQSKRTR